MSRPLTIEEIERVVAYFKEDLQRDANRKVRRHDTAGALACLEGMEFCDGLLFQLKIAAGAQMGQPRVVRKRRGRVQADAAD
jgi:hypothetical protein